MRNTKRFLQQGLMVVMVGLTGCAGFDTVTRKFDQAEDKLTAARPTYEGRLVSAQRVGPMVALAFDDGHYFDVNEAPSKLVPGDILRIYRNDKGYVAQLFRPANNS